METKTSPPAVARRHFLKASTGLAAGAAITATTPRFLTAAERARSVGANSRIRIAQIGCGSRGVTAHMAGIQKHAAALGIPEVKVTGVRFNGPSMMNDALLSDTVDIVGGSPNGMYTLWAKTRNTPQEVRAITALVTLPAVITARNQARSSAQQAAADPGDPAAMQALGYRQVVEHLRGRQHQQHLERRLPNRRDGYAEWLDQHRYHQHSEVVVRQEQQHRRWQ